MKAAGLILVIVGLSLAAAIFAKSEVMVNTNGLPMDGRCASCGDRNFKVSGNEIRCLKCGHVEPFN